MNHFNQSISLKEIKVEYEVVKPMRDSNYISRTRKRELNRPEQNLVYGWSLNNEKLDKDIRNKLRRDRKTQTDLTNELEISRSTLWRIYQGKEITLPTFFKLMEWLNEDLNKYVTKQKLK